MNQLEQLQQEMKQLQSEIQQHEKMEIKYLKQRDQANKNNLKEAMLRKQKEGQLVNVKEQIKMLQKLPRWVIQK